MKLFRWTDYGRWMDGWMDGWMNVGSSISLPPSVISFIYSPPRRLIRNIDLTINHQEAYIRVIHTFMFVFVLFPL